MLRYFVTVPLAFLLLGSGPDPISTETHQETGIEREMAKLQGTWEGVAVEMWPQGKGKADGAVLIIDHANFTFKRGNTVMLKGTLSIDPAKQPKALDVAVKKAHDPGSENKVAFCVYELDKDTLKWCMADPLYYSTANGRFAHRPKAMATTELGQIMFTFKRSKP
jgi:uncharacterized protein (TIGR03067 family)